MGQRNITPSSGSETQSDSPESGWDIIRNTIVQKALRPCCNLYLNFMASQAGEWDTRSLLGKRAVHQWPRIQRDSLQSIINKRPFPLTQINNDIDIISHCFKARSNSIVFFSINQRNVGKQTFDILTLRFQNPIMRRGYQCQMKHSYTRQKQLSGCRHMSMSA